MLTDSDRREIERAYKDAAAKVATLPARLRDEEEQAEAEKRECIPVQPLTRIAASHVVKAIAELQGDLPADLAEIVHSQQRVCSQIAAWPGTEKVFLLSEHLKMILDAAGFGPKDKGNAPLQG